MLLRRSSRQLCQSQRSFSTSTPRAVSLQWEKNDSEALKEVVPPYPHGPTRWYKQSRLGLYGGQRIQFGNNVSEKHQTKTRRSWHPNIFTRKLFSKALNRTVQVRVSARVLRTIDKLGGLDEYLLGEKEARIKQLGESGWWLRWAIMQTPAIKKRFAQERARLGLPEQRDEVESVTEGLAASAVSETPVEETQELSAEEMEELAPEAMEEVPMDDAFQIEQTEDLPPIKFRVGPGQHIMLTPKGWRRTRPDPSYFVQKRKEKLASTLFADYVQRRMEALEVELQKVVKGKVYNMNSAALRLLRDSARTQFRAEVKEKVDQLYEIQIEAKGARKAERWRTKRGAIVDEDASTVLDARS